MKEKKGFTLTELSVLVLIILVLSAVLFPVFIKARTAQANRCQSNMYHIGRAIQMYLSDWDYSYPTNRPYMPMANPPVLWNIMDFVVLSDPNYVIDKYTEETKRFQYGVNWVESLYPYIEKSDPGYGPSVWRCPSARHITSGPSSSPVNGGWPRVTYAFNRNLVEKSKRIVSYPEKMMMLREMDRSYNSVLRPRYECILSTTVPNDPFLGKEDIYPSRDVKYRLHGEGSHILFADGHVKGYPTAYFSSSIGQWDSQTHKWWNWVNVNDARKKTIVIGP